MHPPLRPVPHHLGQPSSARSFSTTTQALARPSRSALKHFHRNIPPYPYGPSLLYKQSNFGLYGGAKPQFGNKVSERNEIKTRRKWVPNIHEKRLWSVAMNRYLRVKVQARVLRTIDKVGGLDEYLMGDSPARIKELGMEGWKMRWRLMQTGWWRERVKRRRMEMGLRPEGVDMLLSDAELLGEDGVDNEEREESKEERDKQEEEEKAQVESEWEEAKFSDEEREHILESDLRTEDGSPLARMHAGMQAEGERAAKPRRSIFQRLMGR
ncbi:MAG: hypothetical protein Q9185_006817 [Variospora sp. 1 TL-2023]